MHFSAVVSIKMVIFLENHNFDNLKFNFEKHLNLIKLLMFFHVDSTNNYKDSFISRGNMERFVNDIHVFTSNILQ